MKVDLQETIQRIVPADTQVMDEIWKSWDNKCIPLRSLGRLQTIVTRLGGILKTTEPKLNKRAVIVMAADNGIIEEGVTQSDHHVTTQVTCNMTRAHASICVMAAVAGADVFPIDIGIRDDFKCPGVRDCKVMHGTNNMTKGPAMSRKEVVRAIQTGIDLIGELTKDGYGLFATGEMGIGNTSTSSAMTSVFLNVPVETVTGTGAGLSSEGLQRKTEAIRRAIRVNTPDPSDPLDVLSKVGGLDIAGLCGCFLGAAAHRVPIIIDGFISSVAALCAVRMAPDAADYMFASHVSAEPAGAMVLEALGLKACIQADMCLGEGSGAVMAMTLFDYALAAYEKIPDFEAAKIPTYTPFD